MNNVIKTSAIVTSLAALAFVSQAARADYSISQTTTTSSPTVFVNGATCGVGPSLLITNPIGEQVVIPSVRNVNPVMFVTTGAQIVGFSTYLPNDLLTRRDDLIARIFAEKATGKLSDSQASSLIAEVQNVSRMPYSTDNETVTSHCRQVKRMYLDFDRVSNDIQRDSHQGNRQLAGNYSFIVL